jgi:integrase
MHKEAKLKYLMIDTDRHGNRRIYLRRPGTPKIRLKETPGSPEFLNEYRAALVGVKLRAEPATPPPPRIQQGTLAWLVGEYMRSRNFRGLVVHQQRARRGILLGCCEEPTKSTSPKPTIGECPLANFGPQHVRLLRDRKAGHGAANNRMKSLSAVFGWAIEENVAGIKSNPCREVKKAQPKIKSTGYHTWTMDEVRQFEARHPVGSMPRLALALLLYTGARRQDAVEFGRQHIGKDGWLHYRPRKTAHSSGKEVDVPVLPALRAIIDATPCGDLTFLVTGDTRGRKPFTSNGFGNWFRKRCDEAGLTDCTAHGLRKAGATIAANNGATPHQLMAIYGWTNIKQAEEYTGQVDRKRLAAAGIKHLNIAAK